MFSDITTLVLAAGALGTAAFGIVEGLKWLRFVGEFGFAVMIFRLGALTEALEYAYGRPKEMGGESKTHELKHWWWYTWNVGNKVLSEELWDLLRSQYRGDQEKLAEMLRQGVRIGLTPETASLLASDLQLVDTDKLRTIAQKVRDGKPLSEDERNVLGRFELAADTRIASALTLAQSHFKGKVQLTAACIAILLALTAGLGQSMSADVEKGVALGHALLIGILAVPVAPITHDIVDALKAVTGAIGPKS